jgi:hypothetical protein
MLIFSAPSPRTVREVGQKLRLSDDGYECRADGETVSGIEPICTSSPYQLIGIYLTGFSFSFFLLCLNPTVPSYGHRPRTSALTGFPRLIRLRFDQPERRDGAFNTPLPSSLFPSRNDNVFSPVFPCQMHRQIGNAVPWPVAAAIGRELRKAQLIKWRKDRQDAMAD